MPPPSLDLSKTYTHSDMLLSPRYSPRISLRRAASYKDNGPLSATSSRFSFNHLVVSPPPSPGLPALIPRHGKPLPTHRPRRCLRAFLWLSGVLVILYYAVSIMRVNQPVRAVGWATDAGEQYEMVGESELPDFLTPVVVTDKKGRSKWTVSIPPDHMFPLEPKQYGDLCSQSEEVAMHVADLHSHTHREHAAHHEYYYVDPNFTDVAEAQSLGLLPRPSMAEDSFVGETTGVRMTEWEVCEKTMTFVLESTDAGLGKTLMTLWMAYGLAEKEGRDFFIDDSNWAYGKYERLFNPPATPHCRPPPRHERLPCPHHARHLIVSSSTVTYTFGGAFNEAYEDAHKMEVFRQKPIFDLARAGYEKLFALGDADSVYVDERIRKLRKSAEVAAPKTTDGKLIGIHVRHGDRHPYEFQYRDSYVPLDRYLNHAQSILNETFKQPGTAKNLAESQSMIVIASDDPDVYESEEFSHAARAQEQVKLASKKSLGDHNAPDSGTRKFIDETVGWEGGFFSGMFWSLGNPSSVPATAAELTGSMAPPTEEALRLREFVGRAYLMDLAVLGKSSDHIICTVSSMGCKVLAVMMGWEDAIVKGSWVNIDGDFEWRGVSW